MDSGRRYVSPLPRELLTSSQTALQKYATTYRASPNFAESFGLLRKAQRIEEYLTVPNGAARPTSMTPLANNHSATEEPPCMCKTCGITTSPIWHDLPLSNGIPNGKTLQGDSDPSVGQHQKLCHQCYFKQKK